MLAIHLDLKTSHYRDDYLRQLFPRLAAAGYTHAVFEIEDKVALDSLAGAAWHEAWSKAEFADLLAACRAAGLEPIPLVQTIGHLEFLLSHAAYHPLRESAANASQICPENPAGRAWLERLIDEVLELFDHPAYIHLGADEAGLLGHCPRCRAKVAATSVSALYLDHLDALVRHAKARGSRPMAWADMVLAHPEALDAVDRDLVWVDWEYSIGDGTPDHVLVWGDGRKTAAEARNHPRRAAVGKFWFAGDALRPWPYVDYLDSLGFDVVVAPASRSYGDSAFVPRFAHLPNIAGAAARRHGTPAPHGFLLTSWALRLNTLESQWPALALPGLVTTADTRFADLRASAAATVGVGPELFAAWELLGQAPPNTYSVHGVTGASFYYGPMPPTDRLLANCRPDPVDAEALRADYARAAAILEGLPGDHPCLAFWRFAVRAHRRAVDEWELARNPEPGRAAELLLEAEALHDEYRELLAPIYTPASIHRELQMIFAGATRYLAGVARG